MKMTPDGLVKEHSVQRSLIRSRHRFTYREVQDKIDHLKEKWGEGLPAWRRNNLNQVLYHLYKLTREMKSRRFNKGGINLDVPEFKAVLDELGDVTAIRQYESLETHNVIEECMLAANRAVTEFFTRDKISEVKSFLFRIHDKPQQKRLEELGMMVESLDMYWPFKDASSLTSRQFNNWLEDLGVHPVAEILRISALRAMAKAEYSKNNKGHFGLGFADYTHFTSPIRRYPDLVVHRLLVNRIEQRENRSGEIVKNLKHICNQSSERERAAQDFERKSIAIRRAQYYEERIGEEFKVLVVKANARGIIVMIRETGTKGFIQSRDLGWVHFDREYQVYLDRRGKQKYKPGSKLRIQIVGCDTGSGDVIMRPA